MKFKTLCVLSFSIALLAACGTSKKTTKTSQENTVSKNGVYAPRNEELVALQTKYKDLNIETLQEGYSIYTGACTKCHGTKNIYNRSETEWKEIIDDMAAKAKLNAQQKNAVHMYVLSIKATQSK